MWQPTFNTERRKETYIELCLVFSNRLILKNISSNPNCIYIFADPLSNKNYLFIIQGESMHNTKKLKLNFWKMIAAIIETSCIKPTKNLLVLFYILLQKYPEIPFSYLLSFIALLLKPPLSRYERNIPQTFYINPTHAITLYFSCVKILIMVSHPKSSIHIIQFKFLLSQQDQ